MPKLVLNDYLAIELLKPFPKTSFKDVGVGLMPTNHT